MLHCVIYKEKNPLTTFTFLYHSICNKEENPRTCFFVGAFGRQLEPVSPCPPLHSVNSSHHSEGESLRKGEKKRLGRRTSPQNGRFGGRATSCEGTEEHTIDQACILGTPAQFTSWARSLWNLMRAVRSPQLTRHALWADPIGGPPKGKMLNFFCLKSTSRPKYQSV